VKIFVVPIGGEFWGVQEDSSQIYAHPITRGGPDGRLASFFYVLFPIRGQGANSRHGADVRVLAFVTFLAGHTAFVLLGFGHSHRKWRSFHFSYSSGASFFTVVE
jgi:hypothetical protein